MQPELHSLVASERLKDDHAGLEPDPDGTATLEPETITIRPLQERDVTALFDTVTTGASVPVAISTSAYMSGRSASSGPEAARGGCR